MLTPLCLIHSLERLLFRNAGPAALRRAVKPLYFATLGVTVALSFFGQQVISGAPDPEAMMTEPIEAQRSYACLLPLIG
jgi:hypothetical protein